MPRKVVVEDKICMNCGCSFNRSKMPSGRLEDLSDYAERKYCSKRCFDLVNRGENHHNWKGGTKVNRDGYLINNQTGKFVHREIVEKYIGRLLRDDENIHHIDGNKQNNDISNLVIMSNSDHRKLEVINQSRDAKGRFS